MTLLRAIGCNVDDVPAYSITEVSDKTGISAYTLRYYDKCGFFPGLARDKRGIRKFSETDIAQLRLIDALRRSGLSIEGLQYFVRLQKSGRNTSAELTAIIERQKTTLEYQVQEINASMLELDSSLQALHDSAIIDS